MIRQLELYIVYSKIPETQYIVGYRAFLAGMRTEKNSPCGH